MYSEVLTSFIKKLTLQVRYMRIHLFTLIEIACLALLWVVKSTDAQIAFPFALVLTIPLRLFVLPKLFSRKELNEVKMIC